MKISKLLLTTSLVCLTIGIGYNVKAEEEKSSYSYKETKVTTTQSPRISRDDATIRRDIDSKIDSMKELDDDLSFKVHDGVVNLSGTVDNFSEKELALRVVSEIPGVVSIVDRIRVE